jgi:hypothetical protein
MAAVVNGPTREMKKSRKQAQDTTGKEKMENRREQVMALRLIDLHITIPLQQIETEGIQKRKRTKS